MKVCCADGSDNTAQDPCLVMVGFLIDSARLHGTQEEFAEVFGLLVLEGEIGKEFDMYGHALTCPGRELAQFCDNQSDFKYFKHFSKFLSGHNCTLKLAPTIGRDANGRSLYDQTEFRLIGPAP